MSNTTLYEKNTKHDDYQQKRRDQYALERRQPAPAAGRKVGVKTIDTPFNGTNFGMFFLPNAAGTTAFTMWTSAGAGSWTAAILNCPVQGNDYFNRQGNTIKGDFLHVQAIVRPKEGVTAALQQVLRIIICFDTQPKGVQLRPIDILQNNLSGVTTMDNYSFRCYDTQNRIVMARDLTLLGSPFVTSGAVPTGWIALDAMRQSFLINEYIACKDFATTFQSSNANPGVIADISVGAWYIALIGGDSNYYIEGTARYQFRDT